MCGSIIIRSDQDYAPDDGDIDGRYRSMWHELERRIFEDLVSMDSRYMSHKEQWSAVLSDLKSSALHKENPEQIAQFLRERREQLVPPV